MSRVNLDFVFSISVFILSLLFLARILSVTPVDKGEISTYSGRILSVECKVYNRVYYIEILVKYLDIKKPILEYLPHSLSRQCNKFISYGGSTITVSKARNYIVGLSSGDTVLLNVDVGLEEANNRGGGIGLILVFTISSFLILIFSLKKILIDKVSD